MMNPSRNQILLIFGNVLLIFTAVLCSFGALISSFSIPVNMNLLVWLWLISAVTLSIVVTYYSYKGLLIFAIPAFMMLIINISAIIDGAMWVVNCITRVYNTWLSVPELFTDADIHIDEPTVFIAAAGILTAILLSVSICLYRSIFGTILITAPVIFLTFVITDTQADIKYLLGIIAVYLVLLISSVLTPEDNKKRGLVTFPALLVTLVFMFLVYMLSPAESYTRNNRIVTLGNNFRVFSSQMDRFGQFWQSRDGADLAAGWLSELSGGIWQFNTETVNILNANRRFVSNRNLLEINANRHGTFYLRGYSMGNFDGSAWQSDEMMTSGGFRVPDFDDESYINFYALDDNARFTPAAIAAFFNQVNPDAEIPLVNMRIRRTGDSTPNITYTPYYTGPFLGDSEVLRTDESFYYISSVHAMVERLKDNEFLPGVHYGNILNDGIMYRNYTDVDNNTAQGLKRLAFEAGINPDAERHEVVDAVARYIIRSGSYSLTPERIPGDVDFALYFLEESQEGYCIHFATAAVLMLRSLDIPARFVSGYVVTVGRSNVDSTVVLTDNNAHAWVEVYYDDIGWLYLEVTPSSGSSYIPDARPHSPRQDITDDEDDLTPTPTPRPDENLLSPDNEPPQNGGENRPTDSTGGDGRQNVFDIPPWLFSMLQIIIYGAIIISVVIVRSTVAKYFRVKRFNQADTNKAVIYIWRYAQRLNSKNPEPPDEIEELALKARFSQHKIKEEERTVMVRYALKLADRVYWGKNYFGRFVLKYVKALY
ncbi:MAG: transglutaminase-like domain-containing protein [Oscillospiraceae bacterium]|nr:transglutaminase-like domain-containing protein [Oscillospiraceae bacterium]